MNLRGDRDAVSGQGGKNGFESSYHYQPGGGPGSRSFGGNELVTRAMTVALEQTRCTRAF